ncbi:MBL fold metallo-hydrolase [Desulfosarcina ovata subsp. sediminis]|uniref:MBL fold metallo-hydrolase n=1 Tax=Desulfosarcina ovata subsp. sediminis TaxID=885957 RepID=A0A5K7ZZ18_9BACT|nr:MBL fold metallo-hydrolase [Desulfosarcina ovata]BBO85493.1 MBL fold metallo-hydrolase [Desulfosarcina ovata subsp. sediminis]
MSTIERIAPDLFLIGLVPPIDGFDNFIAAWLWKGPDATCLVDVGPAATADHLIAAIGTLGVDHLDYICLTHIHVDHAGAVGHLSRRFPDASIVCHPKGVAHIVDPEHLWQGTLKTLGETGRAYGPMLPLDPLAIAGPEQLKKAPFRLLDTPGHSPHHFAIAANGYLFAGEAGGVCLPLPSGEIYLRPATPPRFFLDISLASLDRLIAAKPDMLCYGHFGMRRDGLALLVRHREQLLFWNRTLADEIQGKPLESIDDFTPWVDLMLETDPLMGGFHQLPPAVRQRERSFLTNSVKGFAGYLAGLP